MLLAILPWAAFAFIFPRLSHAGGNPDALLVVYCLTGFISGFLFEVSCKNLIAAAIFSITTLVSICLGLQLFASANGVHGGDAGMAVVFAWALASVIVPAIICGAALGRVARNSVKKPRIHLITGTVSAIIGAASAGPILIITHDGGPSHLIWPFSWIDVTGEYIYYALTRHNLWYLMQNGGRPDPLWIMIFAILSSMCGLIGVALVLEIRGKVESMR